MTPLDARELAKLARVLGLLGSSNAGERDNAALAADRMVRQRGLDWLELLGGTRPEQPISHAGWTASPSATTTAVGDLVYCGRRLRLLNPWEREFIVSLSRQYTFTQKQRATIGAIAAKLRAAESRPA